MIQDTNNHIPTRKGRIIDTTKPFKDEEIEKMKQDFIEFIDSISNKIKQSKKLTKMRTSRLNQTVRPNFEISRNKIKANIVNEVSVPKSTLLKYFYEALESNRLFEATWTKDGGDLRTAIVYGHSNTKEKAGLVNVFNAGIDLGVDVHSNGAINPYTQINVRGIKAVAFNGMKYELKA